MKSFKGRLNRRSFATGAVLFWILGYVAAIPTYITFFMSHSDKLDTLTQIEFATLLASQFSILSVSGMIFYLLSAIVIYFSLSVYVRRLHDLGTSGMLASLVVFEFVVKRLVAELALSKVIESTSGIATSMLAVNLITLAFGILLIYLFVKKGNESSNQYGAVPPVKMRLGEILLGK